MRFIRRHTFTVAVAVVVLLALAGVATAYWTQGGSGTGTAATGNTVGVTVKQTSPAGGLYPGGPPQPLFGNFDNPNASSVFITSVSAAIHPGWSARSDISKPACTSSDFVIAGSAPVSAEVASGLGMGSWSGLTIQMVDNPSTNQDNCKGVTVNLDYTAQ